MEYVGNRRQFGNPGASDDKKTRYDNQVAIGNPQYKPNKIKKDVDTKN